MPDSEKTLKPEARSLPSATPPPEAGPRSYGGLQSSGPDPAADGRILIAGVGNLLRSDDGIGVHAIRELERDPIPGVVLADLGTAVLHALHYLEAAERVLVIDAARGGQPAGTLYRFEADTPARLQPFSSIHALGLREALRLLPPGRPPPRLTVLGVEPASLDYGLELTPALRAALPRVVALARETVWPWLAPRQSAPFRQERPDFQPV